MLKFVAPMEIKLRDKETQLEFWIRLETPEDCDQMIRLLKVAKGTLRELRGRPERKALAVVA